MHGKNKGKKYKKLTGYEVATKHSTKRARAFMIWYGHNFNRLKRALHDFNDEVATETALKIYEAIELKGLAIDSYKHYFFRAYRTNMLRHLKAESTKKLIFGPLSNDPTAEECDIMAAPEYDFSHYEEVSERINAQIMDHVRAKFPPFECSIFEIFIGLQPDITCRKLSIMLGLATPTVWNVLNSIRKDVGAHFGADRDYLLSLLK